MGAQYGRRSRGDTARSSLREGTGSGSRVVPTGHTADSEVNSDSGNAIWHPKLFVGALRSGMASKACTLG